MNAIFDDAEFDRVVHGSLPECGEENLARRRIRIVSDLSRAEMIDEFERKKDE